MSEDIGTSGDTDNTTPNNQSDTSAATDGGTPNQNDQAGKTFTQDEVNAMMAEAKRNISFQATKKFQELGDYETLKELVSTAETQKQQKLVDKGKYEDALAQVVESKDAIIASQANELKKLKVNEPLIKAAATHRSINPEQVQNLLLPKVNLSDDGSIEVLDDSGNVRYDENGKNLSVDNLVKEFLDSNPHFQQPGKSTTNSNNSHNSSGTTEIDILKLDMKNPKHRAKYAEYKKKHGLA